MKSLILVNEIACKPPVLEQHVSAGVVPLGLASSPLCGPETHILSGGIIPVRIPGAVFIR